MVKSFFKNHLLEILLISIIVIISLVLILIFNKRSKEELIARVYYNKDGETIILQEYDLSSYDSNTIIECKLNDEVTIQLEISNNSIRVIEAPCKRKVCIATGYTSNPNKPIICLDLGYSIVLVAKSEVDLVV